MRAVQQIDCDLCGSVVTALRHGIILGKYDAEYQRCDVCGYVFIANPHWLDEAYEDAIAVTDTGIVARNLHLSETLAALIPSIADRGERCLDLGGGTGLLVRLMRDRGFNFHWHDPHARNEFARGFESSLEDGRFAVTTAFEVLEHLVRPRNFIENAIEKSDIFIFSTELYNGYAPQNDWWYLAPETGQHVSFYSEKTLRTLANRYGLEFHSAGWLHVFAKPGSLNGVRLGGPLSMFRRLFSRLRIGQQFSLTQTDHEMLVKALRDSSSRRPEEIAGFACSNPG